MASDIRAVIHVRCQCYMLDRCQIIQHAPSIHEGITLARYGSPMGFPLLIVMIICTVSLQLIMTSCSGDEHETTHKHTNTQTHTAVI